MWRPDLVARWLIDARLEGDPIQVAQSLVAKTPPSTDDLHAALGFLRAAFFRSLSSFCGRKHVGVAFKEQVVDVQALWQAALAGQATLFLPPHDTVPGQLDAERRWLISPITEMDLTAVTQADLTRLVALLVPAGSDRQILDTI